MTEDVKLSSIQVGERFREKFEDIEELAASINKYGLIEPIVIDENNCLIAGERRYKAHVMLKKETILARKLSDLDDLEKKEIELEENIQRKAFTWQEEVKAKQVLHELKTKLHGSAVKGHDSTGWKVKDTALALGESVGTVSMDIQLAKGMRAFPDLLKEKSKTTAYKKLKMFQEKVLQEELAKRMKSAGIIDRPEVICGDCVSEMGKMDMESVDLILSDPPYGIDIGEAQTYSRMTVTDTKFNDSEFDTFDLLDRAFKEMFRVLKGGRHAYIFCGIDKFPTVTELLRKYGFETHPFPIIWDKGSGSYPSQSTTFVHSYEPFVHCWKPGVERRKLDGTPRDIFQVKRVPPAQKIHPTEKPTQLLRDLINLSTLPGEKVLDPFAGSGATIVASKESYRQGIGIELNETYYHGICKRLERGEVNEDVQ